MYFCNVLKMVTFNKLVRQIGVCVGGGVRRARERGTHQTYGRRRCPRLSGSPGGRCPWWQSAWRKMAAGSWLTCCTRDQAPRRTGRRPRRARSPYRQPSTARWRSRGATTGPKSRTPLLASWYRLQTGETHFEGIAFCVWKPKMLTWSQRRAILLTILHPYNKTSTRLCANGDGLGHSGISGGTNKNKRQLNISDLPALHTKHAW